MQKTLTIQNKKELFNLKTSKRIKVRAATWQPWELVTLWMLRMESPRWRNWDKLTSEEFVHQVQFGSDRRLPWQQTATW